MGKPTSEADRLIAELTSARGRDARAPIRERLRELGDEALSGLVAALEHPDCFTRWEAVSLIGEAANPSVVATVVEFALTEDEVHARWRSFWAVSRFERSESVPLLHAALREGGTTRRWRAALMLSMLGRQEAGPTLLEGLSVPDRWIQWEALSAIKALALPDSEDAVAPFLAPQLDRSLRQEAVLALGAIGSARAVTLLAGILDDPEPEVRWRASLALARAGAHGALALLRARLGQEDDPGVAGQLKSDIARLEADRAGAAAA
jgi:HEAT repeat protein